MLLVRAWCECSWHGEYDSQAKAKYAHRRHSCARWEARRAAARRRADRVRAVDRTPKECKHPRAAHVHGTYAAYTLDSCRCLPCCAAASEYNRKLARDNAYGRARLIDATPAREHVQGLRAAGMGLRWIAERSGVSHGALSKLVYGASGRPPSARIDKDLAARLLAVRADVDTLAGGATTPAVGVVRRVQALAVLGWSVAQVCARAGVDRQAVDAVLGGARARISVRHARAIRAVYEDLWDTAPPETNQREKIAASRSRSRAAAARWAPPAAWDDADLDDPHGRPAMPALNGRIPDRTREPAPVSRVADTDARFEDWLHLVHAGEDPNRAARRVGWGGADGLGSLRRWATRNHRCADLDAALTCTRRAA